MKRDKRITLKDLFFFYPYKANIKTTGKTIPQPYVKQSDVVDNHVNSIDYIQWCNVVSDYIDVVTDVLVSGRAYEFPDYLGKLQLRKYKTTRLINWKETKLQNKKVYYRNNDSLHIILKWYRDYERARFRFRFHWKIRMASMLGKKIHKATKKNKNYVYNILDI